MIAMTITGHKAEGIGTTVENPDAAGGDAHLRGDFQQFQPDGVGLCVGKMFSPRPGRRHATEQHAKRKLVAHSKKP